MRIGIIQGRLSKPPSDGHIQQFPENWEKEFELLDDIGLTHIEWLVTSRCFPNVLKLNAKKFSNKITSIGCDNLTNKNIGSKNFLDEQLEPICQFAIKNNITSITIPLLEDSKIDNFVDKFIKNIQIYSDKYSNINFNFELESPYEIAIELCKSKNNFYLTYDTGNITACQYNHEEYIKNCFEFINTVHLKDKTINPVKNVEPGTGDTDFEVIFKTLNKYKYNGIFTLQTSRGKIGDEINTIKQHKNFFEELYAKRNAR